MMTDLDRLRATWKHSNMRAYCEQYVWRASRGKQKRNLEMLEDLASGVSLDDAAHKYSLQAGTVYSIFRRALYSFLQFTKADANTFLDMVEEHERERFSKAGCHHSVAEKNTEPGYEAFLSVLKAKQKAVLDVADRYIGVVIDYEEWAGNGDYWEVPVGEILLFLDEELAGNDYDGLSAKQCIELLIEHIEGGLYTSSERSPAECIARVRRSNG